MNNLLQTFEQTMEKNIIKTLWKKKLTFISLKFAPHIILNRCWSILLLVIKVKSHRNLQIFLHH